MTGGVPDAIGYGGGQPGFSVDLGVPDMIGSRLDLFANELLGDPNKAMLDYGMKNYDLNADDIESLRHAAILYESDKVVPKKGSVSGTFPLELLYRAYQKGEDLDAIKPYMTPKAVKAMEGWFTSGDQGFSPGDLKPLEVMPGVLLPRSKENDRKVAEKLVEQQYGVNKPQPGSRDELDYKEHVQNTANMLSSNSRDTFDYMRSMGTPDWVKPYLNQKGEGSLFGGGKIPETAPIPTPQQALQNAQQAAQETEQVAEETVNNAAQPVQEANDEIQYNHTLAELSGIELTPTETQYLDAQRDIAIDRAITEIEDTFAMEGESMVARQIQNLGTNALGGTIGQTFVKRWQEREAGAKTSAMQGIESSYLSAKEQRRLNKQQQQVGIWDKEFEADVKQSEIDLNKWKVDEGLDFEREKLTALEDQAALDRALQERMGSKSISMYDEANKWSAIGGLAGNVASSDWFGDALTSWLS